MQFLSVIALASVALAVPYPQDAAVSDAAISAPDASVIPTGTHSHHPHGTGASGIAKPTGHHERPSGAAKPSGHHEHPSGAAKPSGHHSHSHKTGHAPRPTATGAPSLDNSITPTDAPILPRQDASSVPSDLKPTHSHKSGAAKPSGHAGEHPSGVAHPSGAHHQDHHHHHSGTGAFSHGPKPTATGFPHGAEQTDAPAATVDAALQRRQTDSAAAAPVDDTTDVSASDDASAATTVDSGSLPMQTADPAFTALPSHSHEHVSGAARPTGTGFPHGGFPHPSGSGFPHPSGGAHPSGKMPHFVLPSGFLTEISGVAKESGFLPMMTRIMSEIEAQETGKAEGM